MIKRTWAPWWERILSWFKIFMGLYMMGAGIVTAWLVDPVANTNLGFIYESKTALIILGIVIFFSGLVLFIGKIRRNRKLTGYGLMAVFLCFTFATVLNSLAFGGFDTGNIGGVVIMGALYLRWRFKTAYIDPNHFTRDVRELEHH